MRCFLVDVVQGVFTGRKSIWTAGRDRAPGTSDSWFENRDRSLRHRARVRQPGLRLCVVLSQHLVSAEARFPGVSDRFEHWHPVCPSSVAPEGHPGKWHPRAPLAIRGRPGKNIAALRPSFRLRRTLWRGFPEPAAIPLGRSRFPEAADWVRYAPTSRRQKPPCGQFPGFNWMRMARSIGSLRIPDTRHI